MSGNGGLHKQGMANPANQPISEKKAKMALFSPYMNFNVLGGQVTLFEVIQNSHLQTIIKCLWLRPSGYPAIVRSRSKQCAKIYLMKIDRTHPPGTLD